jgi:hypothetical protein
MISQSLVIGFHGCDQAIAEKIVAGGEAMQLSRNPWDWLGHGIYFWEDSHDRASRWARQSAGKDSSRIESPVVIGAVIDLGNCLNLVDSDALALVKSAHTSYLETCQAAGSPIAQNRGRNLQLRDLDCAVMETLHKVREQESKPPFQTVRGFFIEGSELYPQAGFRELDHVQICVRDPNQILGCFWPRGRCVTS